MLSIWTRLTFLSLVNSLSFGHQINLSLILILELLSANAFNLDKANISRFGKEFILVLPNKLITHSYPRNVTKIITLSFSLLSIEFYQSRQFISKIRLHVLCSLILIYTGCKNNYSCERRFNPFPNKRWLLCVCSTSF